MHSRSGVGRQERRSVGGLRCKAGRLQKGLGGDRHGLDPCQFGKQPGGVIWFWNGALELQVQVPILELALIVLCKLGRR